MYIYIYVCIYMYMYLQYYKYELVLIPIECTTLYGANVTGSRKTLKYDVVF